MLVIVFFVTCYVFNDCWKRIWATLLINDVTQLTEVKGGHKYIKFNQCLYFQILTVCILTSGQLVILCIVNFLM